MRSREETHALLRDAGPGDWRARADALDSAPADVDPALAAEAAREVLEVPWAFARFCKHLPAPVARRLLTSSDDDRDPTLMFLRVAVPLVGHDASLARAWREAVGALAELHRRFEWGSPQRRAKFEAVARGRFLPAIQTVAVALEEAPLEMLAVLAADGSEASLDALLPHFDRATRRGDDSLNQLALLRPHAADRPALTALLDEVDRMIAAREARSPALELGRALGIEARSLAFDVILDSVEESDDGRPLVEGLLWVDSRRAAWMGATLKRPGRVGGTSWTTGGVVEDALGVGSAEAAELPAWVARAATRLGITFQLEPRAPSLRGRERERIAAWLRGETPALGRRSPRDE
jgi:hypothetical protein